MVTLYQAPVSSGTSALHTALLALGIGPGDEVAVSAYSYVASANVIEMCGATPVFIDIEPRTFNMDPRRFEEAVGERIRRGDGTEPAETGDAGDGGGAGSAPSGGDDGRPPFAAVVVVHTFGQMADIETIGGIAARHDIPVIDDAAYALGGWGNRIGKWLRSFVWCGERCIGPESGVNQQRHAARRSRVGRVTVERHLDERAASRRVALDVPRRRWANGE